jgi:hypothetical protein
MAGERENVGRKVSDDQAIESNYNIIIRQLLAPCQQRLTASYQQFKLT